MLSSNVKSAIETIRGTVRPIVTIIGFCSIIAMVFVGIGVPDFLIALVGSMMAWWFADRAKNGNGSK